MRLYSPEIPPSLAILFKAYVPHCWYGTPVIHFHLIIAYVNFFMFYETVIIECSKNIYVKGDWIIREINPIITTTLTRSNNY